jgi:hypothetical protein
MDKAEWRIEHVADLLARAFEQLREGYHVFAGSWLGRADVATNDIVDHETR